MLAHKAVVIDDEQYVHRTLENYLSRLEDRRLEVCGNYYSIEEAIDNIEKIRPEIVFLDLQLPDGVGLDVLDGIRTPQYQPLVICITAYEEYAIKALKKRVFDYLLKPIDPEELHLALRKAYQELKPYVERSWKVSDQTGVRFINCSDIVRFEAVGNYTHIVLSTGQKLLTAKTLKTYEESKPDHRFVRVHNSHMMNLEYFDRLVSFKQIALTNGDLLPISRQRKKDFLAAMSGQ